jgi:oligopeptide transport system substrate-binding protein
MNPTRLRPTRRAGLALALGAACAAAWGGAVPPGTALAARQEMVRNNGFEPESLDPAFAESTGAGYIIGDVFEGLTALDHHGKVVPGAAESWAQTDPVTWVFKLRAGARWSNGQPVVAEDFVYGWRRFVDPKMASPIASTYAAYLLNGAEVLAGKKPLAALGVRAVDARTLEVRTPGPEPFLPMVLAESLFSPAPKAVVEKFGKDWTRPGNMVGNGAYVLKDWQVNSKVVVEKSPSYWDAANVALTRVTYLAVDDNNADLKLYQSGEDDMMLQMPPGSFAALKAQYPREAHNTPILGLRFYALNNRDPLLKDVRVRKALSMVIDRDVLAQKVTADGQAPAYGLIFQGLAGADVTRYDWASWPMDKRVAEARKLLAEAGVPPGTALSLTYNTSEYHKKMALFMASEWKTKLGLDTHLDSLEFKVLMTKRQTAQYQIARSGWLSQINDATQFLTLIQCGSDGNDDKSCNPKADALIRQGTQTADPVERKALLTEAARLAMEDYPLLPLLQYSTTRLVKPWIGGYFDDNNVDTFRSKDFYVIKH